MTTHAYPTFPSAAASTHGAATPSLALLEARRRRDSLKSLLRTEQSAMAGFLIALAEFDRLRGWEALGHASLFAFLHVELKLPNPSAYWRMSAARVLQRFPDLIAPLRDGRLCCSVMAELAKVLTDENMEAMLPRFVGLSAREAQELVAELQPREAPATRTVVTGAPSLTVAPRSSGDLLLESAPPALSDSSLRLHPEVVPPSQLRTSEVAFGGGERTHTPRDETEPLTADLRRLHITVSRHLLKKLEAARAGLGHAIPGATMEQVIDAAVALLLEKQARARGQVKRPRTALPAARTQEEPRPASHGGPTLNSPQPQLAVPVCALVPTGPPPPRRSGPREAITAAVRRAVWARDGGCCSWPAVILLEPEAEQRVVVECQFGARRSRRAWDYDAMALAEVLGDCSKGMLPLRPVRAWTYDYERGAFNPVSAESVTCVSFCMGG
jgi:hypothetical protein